MRVSLRLVQGVLAMASTSFDFLDRGMAFITILVNLLVAGVFIARAMRHPRLEKALGLVMIILALPVAATALANLLAARPWWLVLLPLPLVAFCIVELSVDYLRPSNFRQTRRIVPYLLLFYVAMIALLGYVFAVGRTLGTPIVFTALATYFISLLATWYSYKKVGHGGR